MSSSSPSRADESQAVNAVAADEAKWKAAEAVYTTAEAIYRASTQEEELKAIMDKVEKLKVMDFSLRKDDYQIHIGGLADILDYVKLNNRAYRYLASLTETCLRNDPRTHYMMLFCVVAVIAPMKDKENGENPRDTLFMLLQPKFMEYTYGWKNEEEQEEYDLAVKTLKAMWVLF